MFWDMREGLLIVLRSFLAFFLSLLLIPIALLGLVFNHDRRGVIRATDELIKIFWRWVKTGD